MTGDLIGQFAWSADPSAHASPVCDPTGAHATSLDIQAALHPDTCPNAPLTGSFAVAAAFTCSQPPGDNGDLAIIIGDVNAVFTKLNINWDNATGEYTVTVTDTEGGYDTADNIILSPGDAHVIAWTSTSTTVTVSINSVNVLSFDTTGYSLPSTADLTLFFDIHSTINPFAVQSLSVT